MKVLGIGDNVCDKYIDSGMMYPGGQALNFAVNAKLGGAFAGYLGVFGDDGVAEHVQAVLDDLGVDRSHCRQYHGENGYAVVRLDGNDRVFLGSNKGGVSARYPLELSASDLEYIAGFDHVHTSNNSYTDGILGTLRACGVSVSYDFSKSWGDTARVQRICPFIDIAFLSCSGASAETLTEALGLVLKSGCPHIVATLGEDGALFFDGKTKYMIGPDREADAVDTLGAGDAFASGFTLEYLGRRLASEAKYFSGADYQIAVMACLERGTSFARAACTCLGAFGHGTRIV
ncbi:MAG: PfkB family carbohydrate kinase [Spirochaetaceae bacterium]|jgi:sugar/nucleoside kinase (ribokinase family)|nr:PfkB family carbohydrate kinase [Spirochaetaceae bacterium]